MTAEEDQEGNKEWNSYLTEVLNKKMMFEDKLYTNSIPELLLKVSFDHELFKRRFWEYQKACFIGGYFWAKK